MAPTPSACALAATTVLLAGCVLPGESHAPLDGVLVRVEDKDGRVLEGPDWGSWTAAPGDTLVEGPAILRIATYSGIRVLVVRFEADAFRGVEDPGWTIPIPDNVQFATWRPAPSEAPCGAMPGEAWQSPSATGSATVRVVDTSCAAYRVVSVPSPLMDQRYAAPYLLERT